MFVVRDARARGAVPKLADVREIMCLEPKALRAAVERMMQLGDYDINTRLQKFLAETNEISGIRSTIETQTAWMTPLMREDMDTATGVKFRDHQAPPDNHLRNPYRPRNCSARPYGCGWLCRRRCAPATSRAACRSRS